MLSVNVSSGFLFSSLADDPDLAELGDEFADEMPLKVEAILAADRYGNRELMVRLVHQLKGAAGSYGFSRITPFAARLEATLKSTADPQSISLQVGELVSICNRVRSRSSRHTSATEGMMKASER